MKIVHALVCREVDYRDTDKILTLLTAEEGRLTVSARGVRKQGSRLAAASQRLCFGRYALGTYRERYILREAEILRSHWDLRKNLDHIEVATEMIALAEMLLPENAPAPEILRLLLGGLDALPHGMSPSVVRAVFQLAGLSAAGFGVVVSEERLMPGVAQAIEYVTTAARPYAFTLNQSEARQFCAVAADNAQAVTKN